MTPRRFDRLAIRAVLVAAFACAAGAAMLFAQEMRIQMNTQTVAGGLPGGIQLNSPVLATGTGLIVGQVVDAGTDKPIAGAIVNIGGGGGGGRGNVAIGFSASPNGPLSVSGPSNPNAVPRVITDSDGHFVFRNLPKGSFNINATRTGFIDGAYGRLRPAGSSQTLDLDDGQRVSDVKVRLFRYASVSGTIVDDLGEPAVGVTVRAFRRTVVGGKRLLATSGISTQTDDRGMYRLGSLMPGDYVIGVPTVQTSMPAGMGTAAALGPDVLTTMMNGGGSLSLNFGGGSQVGSDPRFLLSTSGTAFATDAKGKLLVFPSQYFPNTPSASQAQNVALVSGDDRSGVDMQLKLVPTSNVGGRLIGPDGPTSGFALHLVPAESGLMSGDPDVATAVTNSAGEFMFLGVPAGSYTIETVRVPRGQGNTQVFSAGGGTVMFTTMLSDGRRGGGPPPPTQPTLWTESPISVGGTDINNLTISLRTGLSVSGKFQFEGAAPQPTADDMQTITMLAESADGRTHLPTVTGRGDAKGTFTINGLLPGKYILRAAGAPRGWSFKNAVMGGTDISDLGIEIADHDLAGVSVAFTDQTSMLSGNVKGADGQPDAAAAVVVFPADNRAWENYGSNPRRMRTVRTTKTGAYSLPALPAGDYFVAAIKEEMSGDWQDPRMLDQIARGATRLTIGDNDKHSQDLTTAVLRAISSGGFSPVPETVEDVFNDRRPHGPYVETADAAATTEPAQRGQGAAPPPPPAAPPQRDQRTSPQGPARDATAAMENGTGVVAGLVTLDDGSTPVRRAKVSLRNTESRTERIAMTDDAGRFTMSSLAPGHYSLTATKTPMLTGYYGSKHPGRGPSTPLSVVNGQTLSDLKVQVAKGGVISGTVRDEFGSPVSNASIRLLQYRTVNGVRQLQAVFTSNVQTDDRGDYRAYGLAPGAYAVSVSPSNSIIGGLELRQLSSQDVAQALAEARQPSAGPRPSNTGGMAGSSLAPANQDNIGHAVGFATVFFPGALNSADAGTVNLAGGQEASGIDINVRLVPMSRIEGTLIGPDGQPYSNGTITAVPRSSDGGVGAMQLGRSTADGSFTITNVPPGQYTLSSRTGNGPVMFRGAPATVAGMALAVPPPPPPPPPPPGMNSIAADNSAPTYWASQDVDVNGQNVTGIQLSLQEGLTVSGRVAFTGKTPPPSNLGSIMVGLSPDFSVASAMSFAMPLTPVAADGTFTIKGVPPGTYRVATNFGGPGPGGGGAATIWSARSGMLDGVDVLDRGLEVHAGRSVQNLAIAFTDQPTSISGKLTDASGAPVPDLTIVVFSTDRADWMAGSRRVSQPIRPASDGKYSVSSLPPGQYYLAALTDISPDEWPDPSFMEQIASSAITITLGEGEKKQQDIKLSGQAAPQTDSAGAVRGGPSTR